MKESLELYRVFYAVAKHGSFSKAASSLYISQPAVSQAIRQLEQAKETTLFARNARGASLTAEGRVLFGYVESALNLLETGEDKLHKMQSLRDGELRIGAGDTITRHFLLPFIERFHNEYPLIDLQIRNRTSTVLMEQLVEGKFDLAIVNLPLQKDGVEIIPCGEIHDIFVSNKSSLGKNAKTISWERLANEPLIMLEEKSNSRRYVQEKFFRKGIELHPDIELGAYELLLDLAKIGLGTACVIEEFSQKELESKEVQKVPIKPELPSREIGVCYLSSIPLSPAAKTFLDMLV